MGRPGPRTYLFLYARPPTREVLARHRLGRMILASDRVTAEDVAVYDDCVELPPPAHVAAVVAATERLRFDVLVAQSDAALLPGALIGARRGLRVLGPRAALLGADKWLARLALRGQQVPVPRFALAQTAQDVRRFAERYPIVLKPVTTSLGRHTVRVDSDREIDERVAGLGEALAGSDDVARLLDFAATARLDLGCDPTRQFLVEDFAYGPILECDGLVVGSRVVPLAQTEQIVTQAPHFCVEGYLAPAEHPCGAARAAEAVQALGLTDAGFAVEMRGRTVTEVECRLGEDDGYPQLLHAAWGQYPLLAWLGGSPAARPPVGGGHALAYVNWYREGVVRAVPEGLDAAVLARPGDRLGGAHGAGSTHLAFALASHPASARAAYMAARARVDRLCFEIEDSPARDTAREGSTVHPR